MSWKEQMITGKSTSNGLLSNLPVSSKRSSIILKLQTNLCSVHPSNEGCVCVFV